LFFNSLKNMPSLSSTVIFNSLIFAIISPIKKAPRRVLIDI
jgi:hypothetical protein